MGGVSAAEGGARGDTADYLGVFLGGAPMIDTRAPVEFARGAFPGSVNLPLMTDAEREQVGTCYKRQGQAAAVQLGHRLVSGAVKDARVAAWVEFARRHPDGHLYCFRGGLRSQICQQWLAEAGCNYPRIQGGYKALRQFLLESLAAICRERPLLLVAGHTGSGKTELLQRLPGSIDLEGHAHHRGSAFGRRAAAQPSQIDFENAVSVALLRQHASLTAGAPLILEDEGRYIGGCSLPEPLTQAMSAAPLAVVEVPLAARVEHTYRNYILQNLADWQEMLGGDAGFERFAEGLRQDLLRIRRRLGGVRHAQLSQQLEAALTAHARGDTTLHRHWISHLLETYYDPMYTYQLQRNSARITLRGAPAHIQAALSRAAAPLH